MNQVSKKLCLCCAHPVRGRSDKKFCSDYCRSSYHNQKLRRHTRHMRTVDRILRRNHAILAGLVQQGLRAVSMVQLTELGYQMAYCTSIHRSPDGAIYRHCYEFALEAENQDVVFIRKLSLPAAEEGCA